MKNDIRNIDVDISDIIFDVSYIKVDISDMTIEVWNMEGDVQNIDDCIRYIGFDVSNRIGYVGDINFWEVFIKQEYHERNQRVCTRAENTDSQRWQGSSDVMQFPPWFRHLSFSDLCPGNIRPVPGKLFRRLVRSFFLRSSDTNRKQKLPEGLHCLKVPESR